MASAARIAASRLLLGLAREKPPLAALRPPSTAAAGGPHRPFSTAPRRGDRPGGVARKSPHSKLLRVCSERNSNSHFAAIEADMLRLDWQEAMDALVADWTQKKRWGDFVELESNVRLYVRKNLADLKHYERDTVREHDGAAGGGSLSLSDRLRFRLFPYERIVAGAVRHAISGPVLGGDDRRELRGGSRNGIAMAEVHERILILSHAGELLGAMVDIGGDAAGDAAGGGGAVGKEGWTAHHAACSDCLRSIVSGWFLLKRRLDAATRNCRISDPGAAADGTDVASTTKHDILPEQECHSWAEKWIDFCAGASGGGEGGRLEFGISDSDKPLLMGVARVLSMADSGERQMQSARLNQRLDALFPDDE